MKKSGTQVLTVLDYLKETGVPCKVTLYYPDETYTRDFRRGFRIDLNQYPKKIVTDIISSCRKYDLIIKVGKHKFYIQNNTIRMNELEIEHLERLMKKESMINQKRWSKLNDILNDPNQSTQVPD